MKKTLVALMLSAISFCFIACNGQPKYDARVENDSLYISFLDTTNLSSVRLLYTVEKIDSGCVWLHKDSVISIKELILSDYESFEVVNKTEAINEKAYRLATNNGDISISFRLTGFYKKKEEEQKLDYTCHIAPTFRQIKFARIEDLKYGKLNNPFEREHYAIPIKKWLYANNIKGVSDSIVDLMSAYKSCYAKINLECDEDLPIYKNDQIPKNLSVKSSMSADHYALFLARGDEEVGDFVEWVITNSFKACVSSLEQKVPRYRYANEEENRGIYTIFLVGINNDWSYQTEIIGVVGIDDCPPKLNNYIENHRAVMFFGDTLVVATNKLPELGGEVWVGFGNFEGYGVYLSVPYTFEWDGDVRYIRLSNPNGSKLVIDTHKEDSPYNVRFTTYLETGENFVPVELEDERGNITKTHINITTQKVKKEQPNINIDNSIYN